MYKNKNMVFFFDESFHSRKINNKTIEDKEFFDNYVMTEIGCLKRDLNKNEILYAQFEERFKKLVNELGLNDVKVVIDKEGNPNNNTANACKKEGFKNVIETDSKKNVTLRCTDLMSGFISKMMRAIYEDTKTTDNEEYRERKILNKN